YARLLQTAEKTASPGRGPFDDERRRAAPFPSRREALYETAQHQEQRRRRSDRLTIRQNADADRAHGHQKNGCRQRGLAAPQVSEAPDDDAADGPDDETHAERG